jgi:hypothetical protein
MDQEVMEELLDPRNRESDQHPTDADLLDLMRSTYAAHGYSPQWVEGYIAAQQSDGALRGFAPHWIRKSIEPRLRTLRSTATTAATR